MYLYWMNHSILYSNNNKVVKFYYYSHYIVNSGVHFPDVSERMFVSVSVWNVLLIRSSFLAQKSVNASPFSFIIDSLNLCLIPCLTAFPILAFKSPKRITFSVVGTLFSVSCSFS